MSERRRSRSGAGARVDHDPCIPEIGRSFYFNSAPVLASPRLTLRVGVPQTIELDLFSTGPTGTWDLDAMVPPSLGSSYIFDFQPRAGKNGDKVNLTVTLQSTGGPSFHEGFIITSTLGGTTHLWPVGVVAR